MLYSCKQEQKYINWYTKIKDWKTKHVERKLKKKVNDFYISYFVSKFEFTIIR